MQYEKVNILIKTGLTKCLTLCEHHANGVTLLV